MADNLKYYTIKCPECASTQFTIMAEERDRLEDLENLIGEYFFIRIACEKCQYEKLICLGSD